MCSSHSARMRALLGLSLALLLVSSAYGGEISAKPMGQMTHAIHFTIAPTYDPPNHRDTCSVPLACTMPW